MAEKVFHFRILLDQSDEVFRDILIRPDSSFQDLHDAIIKAFSFSGMEMASFYLSNDEWDKGQEISLMDFGAEDTRVMSDIPLKELLSSEGDKLLYLYDFMRMWIFFVELISLDEENSDIIYPLVALSVGDAPEETSKEPVDSFPTDFEDDIESEEEPGFENIDDLEDDFI